MTYAVADETQPTRRLRDAETLLKMAAGLGRLGAWTIDLLEGTVTWSEEVRAIHEVPSGFRCGMTAALTFYAPKDQDVLHRALLACVKEGRSFDLELQLITARGRQIWVRTIGEPELAADGSTVRVLGAFQDISERRRALQEVLRLKAELEQRVDQLNELTRRLLARDAGRDAS